MSLVGLFAASLIATAQTNTPAGDSTTPAVAPAAPATTPAETTTTVTTTPAAAPTAPQDNSVAVTNAPATTTTTTTVTSSTNAPAQVDAAAAPAASVATGNTAAPHDPNALIPLIVMDEVPLTDAIKNLARQAGLNYMLDPKINYGAPGPDGVIKTQPTVSLRWENLTPDQALAAVLNNYNMIIVDDPKTKIVRITTKDPAAPDPLVTRIVQLKYAYASNMVANVQSILLDKRSKVMADSRTSQLVVVATEKEMSAVEELVARLDTPTKQVLIEAKLVETSKNPTTAKGIDWSGTLAAQTFSFGNGPGGIGLFADTAKGLNPSTFFLNADGVSAVLSFLNKDTDAQILSTPRAVTLDNEEATLSVTTAQPIFATTAGTANTPGGSQVTYTNLGTILRVRPRISANNTINLRVVPEVSDIGGEITKTVGGLVSQADFFDIRKIETQVLIPSGNTLVMGGLVNDNKNRSSVKVPILGDIPGLGWAFRQEAKSQQKKNLIIFITPTIVQNEDFQPTQTDFLKTKPNDKKEADFGPWDSGTPQDWSKLLHKKQADDTSDGTFPDPKDVIK
ncbi:MAG: Type and secretion system protein [Pedosphaera sp.]|nr:Type and secretion system protein [Pedosphaera sp.]